ncbi:hypothetical protein TNIN_321971 [Trichonephila inaurata madagascariensis]|uniref:Uncharacterized protein n=1 Tax=Trichonephila inaurata madagascariensis TaxID=2747483 RepID=A0A8X6XJW0_9ARAC|nr:hypothetical protein TNIN_321971 [Trichonephila inaurata madagascariensis]
MFQHGIQPPISIAKRFCTPITLHVIFFNQIKQSSLDQFSHFDGKSRPTAKRGIPSFFGFQLRKDGFKTILKIKLSRRQGSGDVSSLEGSERCSFYFPQQAGG